MFIAGDSADLADGPRGSITYLPTRTAVSRPHLHSGRNTLLPTRLPRRQPPTAAAGQRVMV